VSTGGGTVSTLGITPIGDKLFSWDLIQYQATLNCDAGIDSSSTYRYVNLQFRVMERDSPPLNPDDTIANYGYTRTFQYGGSQVSTIKSAQVDCPNNESGAEEFDLLVRMTVWKAWKKNTAGETVPAGTSTTSAWADYNGTKSISCD
jgi:hypothetical protein